MKARSLLFAVLMFLSFQAFALELFSSEQAAQNHCPKDVVVWLNLPSGIFHYKGAVWYGNTKKGAYVCQKEAVQEGNRASKNG
jgi:hypothetical protein